MKISIIFKYFGDLGVPTGAKKTVKKKKELKRVKVNLSLNPIFSVMRMWWRRFQSKKKIRKPEKPVLTLYMH